MIYEEDVHEALLFAPDLKPYEGWANADTIAFMLPKRALIPYVKRALVHLWGQPSTSDNYHVRYGNLIIHLVGDPDSLDPFNNHLMDKHIKDVPTFYVREKGQRIGQEPLAVHMLITRLWSPIVFSVMSESDAWLTIRDHVNISELRLAQWQ